jgi:hypothetical protein
MNMRNALIICLLCLIVLPLGAESPPPTDAEVKVAIQSILVAAAASVAGNGMSPPVFFPESIYVSDPFYTTINLSMSQADVGVLRQVILDTPLPETPPQMGFFSALIRSAVPLIPDQKTLLAYLQAQGLKSKEVLMSGEVLVFRTAENYPFRYEGSGKVTVWGSRFSQKIDMHFSFRMPLEGPDASAIVPLVVEANGNDYVHVARQLFPPPVRDPARPSF